jgi:endonuclease-3
MTIEKVIALLREQHGAPKRMPRRDPLSELIAALLSQNTSDVNSGRAFGNLVSTFGTWEEAAEADVEGISEAISAGGLNRVKAPRIKTILSRIKSEKGSLDLRFLGNMPLAEARTWLESLPGVGPKTAACVLLFSLGRPALPVDTHVYRVSQRLGLIDSKVSPDNAHKILGEMVPSPDVYEFHMNMVRHGRKVCRAQSPLCGGCLLNKGCAYGKRTIRRADGAGR